MDLVSGTLSRRFIDGPAALEQRLSEVDRGAIPTDGSASLTSFVMTTRGTCPAAAGARQRRRTMDLRGFTRSARVRVRGARARCPPCGSLRGVRRRWQRPTGRPRHTVQDAWARDAVGRTGVAVHAKLTLFELADPHRGIGALQRVVCRAPVVRPSSRPRRSRRARRASDAFLERLRPLRRAARPASKSGAPKKRARRPRHLVAGDLEL